VKSGTAPEPSTESSPAELMLFAGDELYKLVRWYIRKDSGNGTDVADKYLMRRLEALAAWTAARTLHLQKSERIID
jgi:hypothetical protein